MYRRIITALIAAALAALLFSALGTVWAGDPASHIVARAD